MARMILEFSREEIERNIPYRFICEALETGRFESGSVKRKMKEFFTDEEISNIPKIKRDAHKWYLVSGVPDKVTMPEEIYQLWNKLTVFCCEI